jgi:hypothetical protein
VTARDRRGVELKAGDLAVHASSGRYGAYDVVRVAEIRQRVRVEAIDYLSAGRPSVYEPPTPTWLDPSTLIVVERLPHVEGRLNTHAAPSCQYCDRTDWHSHAAD